MIEDYTYNQNTKSLQHTQKKKNTFTGTNVKVTVLSYCTIDKFSFKTNFFTTSKEQNKLETLLLPTTT